MSKIILALSLLSLLATVLAMEQRGGLPPNFKPLFMQQKKGTGIFRRSVESEESNEDAEADAFEEDNTIETRGTKYYPMNILTAAENVFKDLISQKISYAIMYIDYKNDLVPDVLGAAGEGYPEFASKITTKLCRFGIASTSENYYIIAWVPTNVCPPAVAERYKAKLRTLSEHLEILGAIVGYAETAEQVKKALLKF